MWGPRASRWRSGSPSWDRASPLRSPWTSRWSPSACPPIRRWRRTASWVWRAPSPAWPSLPSAVPSPGRRGTGSGGRYLTSMEPMDTKELKLFWLKKTDGTLVPPWELGSADALSALADGTYVNSSALEGMADLSGTTLTVSASFDAPLDLSEFSAFLYGGWEFPLDGSAPQPPKGSPRGSSTPSPPSPSGMSRSASPTWRRSAGASGPTTPMTAPAAPPPPPTGV